MIFQLDYCINLPNLIIFGEKYNGGCSLVVERPVVVRMARVRFSAFTSEVKMDKYNFNLDIANKSDFDKIAKIYVEEFSKKPFNESWTLKLALKKLDIFSRYCDIWKIVLGEKIIGFLIINPNQWFLGETIFGEEMAILEDFQRKGIGEQSVDEIFEIYKKKGYKKYMCLVNLKSKSFGLQNKMGVGESKFNKLMEKEL